MVRKKSASHKYRNVYVYSGVVILGVSIFLLTTLALSIGKKFEIFQATFQPSDLRTDLDFLQNTLEEGQPSVYKFISSSDLDAQFAAVRRQLDHPMDADSFYRLVTPLVVLIKDGHTVLRPAMTLSDWLTGDYKEFPGTVRLIDGKIYIFDDFATSGASLRGDEIISINGIASKQIYQALVASTPGDGNIATGKLDKIGVGDGDGFTATLFSSMLRPLLGIASPFRLRYVDKNSNQVKEITLDGQTANALADKYATKYSSANRAPRLASGQVNPATQPTFSDNNQVVVWKFGGFNVDNATAADKNGTFIDTAFQSLHDHQTKALVLDLRDTGGGQDSIGERLFSYFTDKPFTYYKDLVANKLTFSFLSQAEPSSGLPASDFTYQNDGKYHWTGHSEWGTRPPRQPGFEGSVYVLINGGCFSTCAEFASSMSIHNRATFIGEETGGRYDGNTSGYFYDVYLPHTKIALHLPVISYQLPASGVDVSRGVKPDYLVQPKIEDLLDNNDKALQTALSLARESIVASN